MFVKIVKFLVVKMRLQPVILTGGTLEEPRLTPVFNIRPTLLLELTSQNSRQTHTHPHSRLRRVQAGRQRQLEISQERQGTIRLYRKNNQIFVRQIFT